MNTYRRFLGILALLLLPLLLLSSCTTSRTLATLETGAATVEPRTFTVIGTADLQGQLEAGTMKVDLDGDGTKEERVMGGISRLATLIAAIKAEDPSRVVVVSTGDDLMNKYFHTFKGKAIFELMSEAGYEIYVLGNHEFDKGPEVLAEALWHADFEVVCTDLAVEGTVLEGLCQPLLLRDHGGLKVGYFSLMTENFPLVTSGGDVLLNSGNVEAARWAVRELRERGAELVVALTHVGEARDREIAEAVPGIDIIFGAHSHEYTVELVRVGRTLIVNGGEKGPFLVRLDVTVGSDGEMDAAAGFELIPVTDDVAPDEEVEALLARYRDSFPDEIVLGRTSAAWDMTKHAIRGGESPVANLVNDLMREKFRVDVVLNNAGAFRGKKVYGPGPVTDAMLHEIDEFSNYAYSLDLEGRYLAEILERSAACFGEGGLLHVSGLRYMIDLTRAPQEISRNDAGEWSIDVPGERVTYVRVVGSDGEWAPLDPDRTYRVLSNSFIVKRAGDGYFWFERYGDNVSNTYSTFYSILAELAGLHGVLDPGDPDGRLTVIR